METPKIVKVIKDKGKEKVFEVAVENIKNHIYAFEIQSTDGDVMLGVDCWEDLSWGVYANGTMNEWAKFNEKNPGIFAEFERLYS